MSSTEGSGVFLSYADSNDHLGRRHIIFPPLYETWCETPEGKVMTLNRLDCSIPENCPLRCPIESSLLVSFQWKWIVLRIPFS